MAKGNSVSIRLSVEDADKVRRALEQVGAQGERAFKAVNDALAKGAAGPAADDLRRKLEALQGRYDPAAAAARRLARENETLAAAVRAGGEAAALAARVQDAMRRAQEQAAGAARSLATANDNLARSTALSHRQQQVFQAGVLNTFQSLASGAPVFRTLVTQGAQMVGVFGSVSVGALAVGAAAAAGGAAVAKFAAELVRGGDLMTATLGRLRAATGDTASAVDTYERLYRITQQTGVAVADSAGSFVRFNIAAQAVGATRGEVVTLVEAVQKFGIVSGATTQEATAGAVQLGQALASGRLQGDELRSILENMPLLGQALARELGVSVGQLREMGAAGQLTAERVFRALLKTAEEANEQFARMPMTVERAGNVLAASWDRFLGRLDESLGVSEKLASVLSGIASLVDGLTGAIASETPAAVLARLEAERAKIGADGVARTRMANGQYATTPVPAEETAELDRRIAAVRQLVVAEERAAQIRADAEAGIAANAKRETELAANRAATAKITQDLVKEEKARNELRQRMAELDRLRAAGPDRGGIGEADYVRLKAAAEREYADAVKVSSEAERKAKQEKERLAKAVNDLANARAKEYDDARRAASERAQAVINDDIAEGARVYAETRTEAERYGAEVRRLQGLLGRGRIDQDTYNRAVRDADPAYRKAVEAAKAYAEEVDRTARQIGEDVSETLFDAMTGNGKAQDFLDFFKNIFKRLAVEALNAQIVLPIVTPIVSAVPGLFGIQAPGAGGVPAVGGGAGGSMSLLSGASSLGNLFSGGSSTLFGIGSSIATSSFGQAIGLSSAASGMALDMTGGAVLTGAGNAFANGLSASPWGFIGSLGANALGLGGGIGGTIGGMVGSVAGGAAGSAALGSILGAAGGPLGAIVGGFAGTALGGLFGGRPSIGPRYGSGFVSSGGATSGYSNTDNGGDAQAAARLSAGIGQAFGAVAALSGARLGNTAVHVEQRQNGAVLGLNGATLTGYADAGAALVDALKREMARGAFVGAGSSFVTAAANSNAKAAEDFLADLGKAATYDGIVRAAKALTDVEQAMKALTDTAAEQDREFKRLGLDVAAAQAGRARSFDQQVADTLRQIEDAEGYALDLQARSAAARLDAARRLGADEAQVMRLNDLERRQLLQQFGQAAAAQAADLKGVLDRIRHGDLGGATAAQSYAGARGAFAAAAAQGSLTGQQVEAFLSASLRANSLSDAFRADRAWAEQATQALIGRVPGFADGTLSAPPGMAWVGEAGPELVRFRGGEQVIPSPQSFRMAANGDNGAVVAELRHVVAAIRDLMRSNALDSAAERRALAETLDAVVERKAAPPAAAPDRIRLSA